ncbi:Retrovirus-related Pol polyprotein from transposon 17.6, partial [Mucuna pruriens]
MDLAQLNYTTIEKELLEIVFALDKFLSYLLGSKIIVFFDYATLRLLLKKADAKLRLIRWILLLQEFNIEIKNKKGVENSMADHLSRIKMENDLMPIRDEFPDEQLLYINMPTSWFANICNFVAASQFPSEASRLYKEKLKSDAKYYIWDDPYLWRRPLCHQLGQPRNYLTMGSIGPPFLETPINSSPPAKNFGVPKALISEIEPCPPYFTRMGWYAELPQHTTPRQTTKLKSSTGK